MSVNGVYETVKIGNVCSVGDGAHAKVARQETGVPYLTSKNIGVGQLKLDNVSYISEDDFEKLFSKTSTATRRLQPGDVLIGIIGTFGNAYRYKDTDHFGISSSVAILRPNQAKLGSDFLYHVVTSNTFRESHIAVMGGSAQGYTNIPTIKSLPIPLPPLPTQRRIAQILGRLDDKIELNRRLNRTLEAMAQTLFKHHFVDFGPYQDGEFVESELGLIPKGWGGVPLSQVVEIETKSINPASFPDEIFNHYSIPAHDDLLPTHDLGKDVKSNKYLITTDRILVSKLNPRFYRIWTIYHRDDYRSFSSTEFINYVSKSPDVWAFMNCYLRSQEFITAFRSRVTGTTGSRQRVKPQETLSFRVAQPTHEVLQWFERVVSPYFKQFQQNIEENRKLAEIRDYLLPKLLSGEVGV